MTGVKIDKNRQTPSYAAGVAVMSRGAARVAFRSRKPASVSFLAPLLPSPVMGRVYLAALFVLLLLVAVRPVDSCVADAYAARIPISISALGSLSLGTR